MNGSKRYFTFFLLFATGVCLGFVIARVSYRHHRRPDHKHAVEFITGKLERELELSRPQLTEISPIIEKSVSSLEELRNSFRPKVDSVLKDSVVELKPHLSVQQQERLDQLYERVSKRWNDK